MKYLLNGAASFALALSPLYAMAHETPGNPARGTAEARDMTDIVALMHAWLETFGEGEFDAFPGKVSPDFTLHLPFVPAGVPNEIRGREAVRERLASSARGRSKLIFHDVRILRTEDPELLVTTARGEATMANGKPYRNSYVMLTRIRGDEVIEHTEYLNPLAIMAAMGD